MSLRFTYFNLRAKTWLQLPGAAHKSTALDTPKSEEQCLLDDTDISFISILKCFSFVFYFFHFFSKRVIKYVNVKKIYYTNHRKCNIRYRFGVT